MGRKMDFFFGVRRFFMGKEDGESGCPGYSGNAGDAGKAGYTGKAGEDGGVDRSDALDRSDVPERGREVKDGGSVCYGGGEFGGDLGFFRLVMRMREAQREDGLCRTLQTMEERRRWEREVDAYIKRNIKDSTVKTLFD